MDWFVPTNTPCRCGQKPCPGGRAPGLRITAKVGLWWCLGLRGSGQLWSIPRCLLKWPQAREGSIQIAGAQLSELLPLTAEISAKDLSPFKCQTLSRATKCWTLHWKRKILPGKHNLGICPQKTYIAVRKIFHGWGWIKATWNSGPRRAGCWV